MPEIDWQAAYLQLERDAEAWRSRSPEQKFQQLVLWARENSVRLRAVQIGDGFVNAEFDDLAVALPAVGKQAKADPAETDIHAAWAKELGVKYNGDVEDDDE